MTDTSCKRSYRHADHDFVDDFRVDRHCPGVYVAVKCAAEIVAAHPDVSEVGVAAQGQPVGGVVRMNLRHSTRHRASGPVNRCTHPMNFEPRHCAGHSCTHNHTGGSVRLARLGTVQGWPSRTGAA